MPRWIRSPLALLALLLALPASAKVVGEEVRYTVDGQQMKGYIARNTSVQGLQPAVLVVHEWWGHNAYARQRANMLAAQGYVAMALDLYGADKLATHPDEAMAFMSATMEMEGAIRKRFTAARELLADRPYVDPGKTAAIGYCFGGGVVLNMARAGMDLAGVVSFHGSLGPVQNPEPGQIKAPILVFNGEADPMVPPAMVESFQDEMTQAGADMTYVGYPGVVHSFTNPGATAVGRKFDMPLAYDQAADEDSWAKTSAFLRRVLRD
ncbi:MAG: dienelactone hydrolase family protein [Oceanococcaceae bacterium]